MLTTVPQKLRIYRLRPGKKLDSYGDEVDDWSRPVKERLRRASIHSGALGSASADSDVETPTSRLTEADRLLLVIGRADLTEYDRIEVAGGRNAGVWHIQGEPYLRPGLAAGIHTAARLARTERRS